MLGMLVSLGCAAGAGVHAAAAPFAAGARLCTVVDESGDPIDAHLVERALAQALPRVQRFGTLRAPVTLRVLATHAALEQVARQPGLPWLRAWSFIDEIYLQSPSTWTSLETAPDDSEQHLVALLAHELTHALMYQLLTRADGTLAEEPPLWFREGMASVGARQGDARLTPAQLVAWLAAHPGSEPLAPTPELLRAEQPAVYGAAHRAFASLLSYQDDQAPLWILARMRSGASFANAFASQTGMSESEFLSRVRKNGFAPLPAQTAL
jgi:hypothetical protein